MVHKTIATVLLLSPLLSLATTQWSQQEYMAKDEKIYVAGHTGLVGSAIMRALQNKGYTNLVTREIQELDLRNSTLVDEFFATEKPDYVFLAAARVGGIKANWDYPADFIYDNLMISANIIHASYKYAVKKLIFLGSSCIYPRACPQPIKEEYLLTGELEKTNEPYAIAKIAGIKLCQSYNRQHGTKFIACMPTNLYGPHDNFNLATSHVLPALIAKIHEAKIKNSPSVTIWGTGKARREFLYVDDLADATIYLMNHYESNDIVNIGVQEDLTITELASLIKKIVGYEGTLVYDPTHPDGTERKLLDMSVMHSHGWHAPTSLENGITQAYEWYKNNYKTTPA